MKSFESPGELQTHFDQLHETQNESETVVSHFLPEHIQGSHKSPQVTQTPLQETTLSEDVNVLS